MTDVEKQDLLRNMLSCEICREYLRYLSFSMHQPLRCPGLDYNDKGERVTKSGKLWSVIEKEYEDAHIKEFKKFREKHRQHLKEHLGYKQADVT
jgi:hypothetical protein